MRDLEMIVALLGHFPECHVRRVAVAGRVERSHPEWKGLELERSLAAEKRFARERVDFRNLFTGHGVAPDRRTIAVDHQELAGAAVRPVIDVPDSSIDR